MKNAIGTAVLAFAALGLGGCATYKDNMPAWMPGSSAVSVKLSGAEEVPPVNASGSGSGSFRVAEDGTLSGSVTTKDVQGTMAHIHRGAKGQNGPVVVPLTKNGVDLVKAGIIDPALVSRTALINAASVAGLMLTTNVLVTELKDDVDAIEGSVS